MRFLLLAISGEGVKLLLAYGTCAGLILAAAIVMGFMKRQTKRQMRPVAVKRACIKAKTFAEKELSQGTGVKNLLGATKLLRLSGLVSNAAWLAYQIVENKRDILFDGIAGGLDGLATSLAKDSEQGYLPEEEYENSIRAAINVLNSTIEKLDKIIAVQTAK